MPALPVFLLACAQVATSTSGVDWLVLPLAQYNDDAGLIYGLHFPIAYRKPGVDPYVWFLEVKFRHSTKNRHAHFLQLDVQDFFGLRFQLRGEFLRITDANYFGVEETREISDFDSKIYQYRLTEPRVQTLLSQKFEGNFLWGVGLSFNDTWTKVQPGSILDRDRPPGWDGGHAFIGLFTLAYDSRDSELVPTRGLFVEAYAKAATRPFGSSTNFQGVGLTAQGYYSPLDRLVLAQRFMVEVLGGDVPFYEMARIGGRTSVFGVGGVFTQRGEPESRFIGKHKALSNSEVRYYFPKLFDFVTFGLGAFGDVSWLFGEKLVPSGGGEISVKYKELIVFRIDGGVSAEGRLLYIEGFHMF